MIGLMQLPVFLITSLIMILGSCTLESGAKTIRAGDSEYTLSDLMFKGTIHGVEVQLNGTAQSIYHQFTSLYPKVVANYNATTGGILHGAVYVPVHDSHDSAKTHGLKSRNKIEPPTCHHEYGFSAAYYDVISDGVKYLKGLQGGCCVGPRSCVRISCSWDSAIYLCNDRPDGICPSCIYLASYAEDIQNQCSYEYLDRWWAGGQLFDTDNYNIIVRREFGSLQC